jgi:hypothetical protein
MQTPFQLVATQVAGVSSPLLAALDSALILLILAIVSAVASWLKKRGQVGELLDTLDEEPRPTQRPLPPRPPPVPGQAPPAPPRQAAPPPAPPKALDWEEALRRLLQGEPVEAPPPRPAPAPPPPPPVIASPPARPVAPAAHAQPKPVLKPAPAVVMEEEKPKPALAHLTAAATAYERAAHIDQLVQQRLHRAERRTAQPTPAAPKQHSRGPSNEVAQTLTLLRQPRTARQAVIASVIFAPPKALEN